MPLTYGIVKKNFFSSVNSVLELISKRFFARGRHIFDAIFYCGKN